MKNHRKLTLILALALLMSSASCAASDAPEDTSKPAGTTSEVTETDKFEKDDLPELSFDGKSVHIFLADYEITGATDDFIQEEEDGDIVHDAVYKRNRAVEERLDTKLEWNTTYFEYGTRDQMYNLVRGSVMADDGTLDIIAAPSYFMSTFIMEGILRDLSELPYIDFDKPWWYDGYNNVAKVNGKRYTLTGDASLTYFKGMYALLFNKSLGETYGIDVPYETVLSGGWTLDEMDKMIKNVYSDLNGNGSVDEDDLFGISFIGSNYIYPFMEAFNVSAIDASKQGNSRFVFDSEHNADAVTRLCRFLFDNDYVWLPEGAYADVTKSAFYNGRSLLTGATLQQIDIYRGAGFDYGVLPYPKYDGNQSDYYTRCSTGTTVFAVAGTADTELSAAVLEAMGSESYRTVIPAYYEIALKVKYTSDDESMQVLDLIKNSSKVDFAGVFAAALGGLTDRFRESAATNNPDWVSTLAGIKEKTLTMLDDVLEAYN